MTDVALTSAQESQIDDLVRHYVSNQPTFIQFVDFLRVLFTESPRLLPHVHSMKWRVKDQEHLRDKLRHKLLASLSGGPPFEYTVDNLFEKVNDLAGFRILHLYTRQMEQINRIVLQLLDENQYNVIEGPIAITWDDESREYFRSIDIDTRESRTMYTSVHYVIEANTRTKYTAEIQVRTLAEELWGEVDHLINYPSPSAILACQEQIKVLARVTSSCSRLVDAIVRTVEGDSKPIAT